MENQEHIDYENRVRTRVLILQKLLEEGKITLVRDSGLEESLKACRFASNGEVDLSTVDGRVRSLALAAEAFMDRQEWKETISLYEIQYKYFTLIENNFKFFYDKMVKVDATPHQFASFISSGESGINIDSIYANIPEFMKAIVEFWKVLSEPAYIHVEDMDSKLIKGVLGGDLFASNEENIASKCGIYIDTIILPCPFIRSHLLFNRWEKSEQVYYLVKHALNVLKYKNLALADIDPPIVAILPDKGMMPDADNSFLQNLGTEDGLFHANKIFGTDFKDFDELVEYAGQFDTIDKLMPKIKDSSRIIFDLDDEDSIEKQIIKRYAESASIMQIDNLGIFLAAYPMGRMGVCNELLYKSTYLYGTPLIEAPTSWEYFKWKLEYDAERSNPDRKLESVHIVNGLSHIADTPLRWIGKIPEEGLIEIRKSGAINEIREIVSKGVDEITDAAPMDFTATSHRVFNNLNAALKKHQDNIKELTTKSWKIAGKDFGSWLVVGSIELAAACTGHPLYGVPAVLLPQLLDVPKLKELPESINMIKQVKTEKNNLKKSPIGLMFKYQK